MLKLVQISVTSFDSGYLMVGLDKAGQAWEKGPRQRWQKVSMAIDPPVGPPVQPRPRKKSKR